MSSETLISNMLAILSNGAAWTQGATARKSNNDPCSPLHPGAVKWDLQGALIKAQFESTEPNFSNYQIAYNIVRGKIPPSYKNRDFESYNDSVPGWIDILNLFETSSSES